MLHRVSAEVRGNGDPRPPLAALCTKRGWSVIDLSTGSPVDLSTTANPTEWDRFRNWRDRAIDDLRGSA